MLGDLTLLTFLAALAAGDRQLLRGALKDRPFC